MRLLIVIAVLCATLGVAGKKKSAKAKGCGTRLSESLEMAKFDAYMKKGGTSIQPTEKDGDIYLVQVRVVANIANAAMEDGFYGVLGAGQVHVKNPYAYAYSAIADKLPKKSFEFLSSPLQGIDMRIPDDPETPLQGGALLDSSLLRDAKKNGINPVNRNLSQPRDSDSLKPKDVVWIKVKGLDALQTLLLQDFVESAENFKP